MKTRLTEWPKERPSGEWVYVTAQGVRWRGEFSKEATDWVGFVDEGGDRFWDWDFGPGEFFEKVEVEVGDE